MDKLNRLTNDEKEFVCSFANRHITQIPYVELNNIQYLNLEYLVRKLKRFKTFTDEGKVIADSIIDKLTDKGVKKYRVWMVLEEVTEYKDGSESVKDLPDPQMIFEAKTSETKAFNTMIKLQKNLVVSNK